MIEFLLPDPVPLTLCLESIKDRVRLWAQFHKVFQEAVFPGLDSKTLISFEPNGQKALAMTIAFFC